MIGALLSASLFFGTPWAAPRVEPAGLRSPEWISGPISNALARAKSSEKPVLAYFWMDGSRHCSQLWGDTLTAEAAQAPLDSFVCYSVNVTEAASSDLVQRFSVTTLPTLLFLTPGGEVDDAVLGFIPLADFLSEVQRVHSGQGTVRDLTAQAEAAPDDLARLLALAQKLAYVGRRAESEEVLDSIRRADPEGETLVGAQLAFYDVRDAAVAASKDPNDPTSYELREVYRHVERIKPPPIRFEAWSWLGQVEEQRGDGKQSRRNFGRAWENVAESDRLFFGAETVNRFWDAREELSSKDKSLALEIATRCTADAESLLAEGSDDFVPPESARELEFEGTNEEFVALMLEGLACAYYLNGKRSKAIKTVQRGLELDPGSTRHVALLSLFEGK